MFRKKRAAYITAAILALAAAALAFAGCKPYNGSQFEIDAKSSFSNAYFTLGEDSHGSNRWREGMVTGNGSQGAVISGSPYDDTIIFQNIHFILPNDNPRVNPDTSAQLEEVRRNIIEGRDITDTQSYDDVYCYHPGGVLRIKSEGGGESGYMRYTDYETAVVGTRYTDDGGQWDRITFTSFADDVTITQISASDKGEKVDVTLSYDDISAMMKFGRGSETELSYTKRADADGSFLTFAAKYPSYANSELKDGGYATVCYIVAEGGSKRGTEREAPAETQYAGDSEGVVEIKDAENVYVIAASDRTYDMDDIGTDGGLIRSLRDKTRAVAEKYADGDSFGIDAALDAHTAVYSPIFNSVSFSLGGSYDIPNEKLSAANLQNMMSGTLDASLAERAYYSGRYAQICCSGTSTSRLYGMWTGEWASEWGSKYTMDANVNLQVSAMNTGNISTAPVGYANFILRQVADWEDNALATHGYADAIQAPVNSDGDMALMTESAYPYPFRYWNAGAAWLLYPLYETLQCYGDMRIPVTDEFDLDELRSVLSPEEEDLSDSDIAAIKARGYLDLRSEILYPLLIKSYNYWEQLLTPEYYTDPEGYIHYSEGKTSLSDGESYCIVPSYSPENTPSGYPSPAAANAAIDIAACASNVAMLVDIAGSIGEAVQPEWQALAEDLPPLIYDNSGAIKEWACYDFAENNEHRHLSHLYCVWPLDMTKSDPGLEAAARQAVANRVSENDASHALVHRALIGARLGDREIVTDALSDLMNSNIWYDSLLTNHHTNANSGYCTDFAIGYTGIINECLVYSAPGETELLPALPQSGFDEGSISGLRLRSRAVLTRLEWSAEKGRVKAELRSDVDQTIVVSCGPSGEKKTVKLSAGKSATVEFSVDLRR